MPLRGGRDERPAIKEKTIFLCVPMVIKLEGGGGKASIARPLRRRKKSAASRMRLIRIYIRNHELDDTVSDEQTPAMLFLAALLFIGYVLDTG